MNEPDLKGLLEQIQSVKESVNDLQKEIEVLQSYCEKLENTLLEAYSNSCSEKEESKVIESPEETNTTPPSGLRFAVTQVFYPPSQPPAADSILGLRNVQTNEQFLVVEKKKWFNDYCFVVHTIDGEIATGNCYKSGILYKRREQRNCNEKGYKQYVGRYLPQIIAQETDLLTQNSIENSNDSETIKPQNNDAFPNDDGKIEEPWDDGAPHNDDGKIVETRENCAYKNNGYSECPYNGMRCPPQGNCDSWRYNNQDKKSKDEGWPTEMQGPYGTKSK